MREEEAGVPPRRPWRVGSVVRRARVGRRHPRREEEGGRTGGVRNPLDLGPGRQQLQEGRERPEGDDPSEEIERVQDEPDHEESRLRHG